MKNILLLCLVLGIACQPASVKHDKQTSSTSQQNQYELPISIKQYIKSNLPDYEFTKKTDFDELWWQFNPHLLTPQYVMADINDDQILDYAILLKKDKSLNLLILTSGNQRFKHWLFTDLNSSCSNNKIPYGLYIETPQKLDLVIKDKDLSLALLSNSFGLMNFEIKEKVYYWNEDSIIAFSMF